MCIAERAQVQAVRPDGLLVVRSADRSAVVSSLALGATVSVGSWVLIHAGFALDVVEEPSAEETPYVPGRAQP
jgi:hydrogenase maturation factor